MRTPKPPSSTTVRRVFNRLLPVASCLLAFTLVAYSGAFAQSKDRPATIKFSHRFHVRDAGAACADCHTAAPTSTLATDTLLATHENCKSCHEEQLNSKCAFCHTNDDPSTYAASALPKRNLLFSHKRHVETLKVECEKCHTGVDKAEIGVSVAIPAMPSCNTCHNDVKASNACEGCHVDMAALRPREHNRTDFVREHKMVARISTSTCASCHTQESCADCHNGSDLLKIDVAGKDLMSLRSPRLTSIDRGQGMRTAKVHDLNFKFTHGLAVEGKTSDCQSCHNQQTFCATCHESGGNVNQGRFQPESHRKPGFATIGVGSGGGAHAKLARRDIESCASCHDTQGTDPACITCHMDSDGIKGTNARTHQPGFMAGEHGSWHTDPGATCYVCHTDANARVGGIKGQKFCGYCHK
ncbi:MAG: cytochrome C [Ignavibacteriales bacterium]|nr:cytochrome C [Ignavibacteriales bacterium]